MGLPHERFDRLLESGQLMSAAAVEDLTEEEVARLTDAVLALIPATWDANTPMTRTVDWAVDEGAKQGYFGHGDRHGNRLAERLIDSFSADGEVPGIASPSVRVANIVAESGIGTTELLLTLLEKVEGREHLVDRLLAHPAANRRVFRTVAASYNTGDHARVHNALLDIDEARRDPVVRSLILESVGPRMRRMDILRRFILDDMDDVEEHFREALRLRPATTLGWLERDPDIRAVVTREMLAPALEHDRKEIRIRAIGVMGHVMGTKVEKRSSGRGRATRA